MKPAQLTHKLCWLLSLCGFLRPSDIARIQEDRTVINAGTLNISILAPKEKRGGQRITRTVLIQPHDDVQLCPVRTYQAYKSRIAITPCVRPHPVFPNILHHFLVRDLRDHTKPIGAERIGKHINSLTDLIPRTARSPRRPKTRSIGPSRALASGVHLSDILTQGSWASSSVFMNFYRQVHRSTVNLTDRTLSLEHT